MNYIGARLSNIMSVNELEAEIVELQKQVASGGALTNNLTTTVSVGGVPAGTTFTKGTSFEAILNAILAPEHPILATPVISISNSTVYWTAIPDATYYLVYVDGQPLANRIEETLVDLSAVLFASGEYEIQVSACAENYTESPLSNTVNYTISSTDIYYGGLGGVTAESFREVPGWFLLERTVSTSSSTHQVSWTPETPNPAYPVGVLFIIVKDGIFPTGGALTSGGLSSFFTGAEIMGIADENNWNCSGPENGHEDLVIDGVTYHVYGIRSTT